MPDRQSPRRRTARRGFASMDKERIKARSPRRRLAALCSSVEKRSFFSQGTMTRGLFCGWAEGRRGKSWRWRPAVRIARSARGPLASRAALRGKVGLPEARPRRSVPIARRMSAFAPRLRVRGGRSSRPVSASEKAVVPAKLDTALGAEHLSVGGFGPATQLQVQAFADVTRNEEHHDQTQDTRDAHDKGRIMRFGEGAIGVHQPIASGEPCAQHHRRHRQGEGQKPPKRLPGHSGRHQ